jgi:hypothetical protein
LNPGIGKRTSSDWSRPQCGAPIMFNPNLRATAAQAILKKLGRRFAAWRNLSSE